MTESSVGWLLRQSEGIARQLRNELDQTSDPDRLEEIRVAADRLHLAYRNIRMDAETRLLTWQEKHGAD